MSANLTGDTLVARNCDLMARQLQSTFFAAQFTKQAAETLCFSCCSLAFLAVPFVASFNFAVFLYLMGRRFALAHPTDCVPQTDSSLPASVKRRRELETSDESDTGCDNRYLPVICHFAVSYRAAISRVNEENRLHL